MNSFKSFKNLNSKMSVVSQSSVMLEKIESETTLIQLRQNLFNVLKNSFNFSSPEVDDGVMKEKIVTLIFSGLNKIKYFSKEFDKSEHLLNIINLQPSLEKEVFRFSSNKIKLRTFCLLFCKYVNRTRLANTFEDFFPDICFESIKTVSKYINSKAQVDLPSDDKISDYFYTQNIESISIQSEQRKLKVIRKVLVYFVMLMDLFKIYLNFKTKTDLYTSQINEKIHKENKIILENTVLFEQFKEAKWVEFKVDADLLNLSIEELLERVDILLFPEYIILSNLFIMKSLSSKLVTLTLKNKKFSFQVTFEEQQLLLCAKIKRKDELIKYSYRFIRKQIFKEFKAQVEARGKTSLEKVRKEFNKVFLNGDPKIVEYYKLVDISKKRLDNLSSCTLLQQKINQFKIEEYFPRQIEKLIFFKNDKLFEDQLTFDSFLKSIFCSQFKNSMILQDIIQSYFIFDSFFEF